MCLFNIKAKYFLQFILYFIAFSVVFSTMDIITATNNLSFIDCGDAVNQGYAVIGYIQSFIKNRDFFLGIDFSVGLGEDNLMTLACHGFLNPIHWIIIFLFQSSPTYLLYKYISVTKFFLGGFFFLIYTNYKNKNLFLAIPASLIYSFSMWGLVSGVAFLGFYDVLIALPIAILGIDDIFEDSLHNFIAWPVVLSILYLGTQGFYYLFMHCLIIGMYFLVKLVWYHKNIMRHICCFAMNCVCSLLIIAPILLPNIYYFFQSSRNVRAEYHLKQLLPSVYELKTFLRSFFTPTSNTCSHYLLTTIALFALVVFMLNYKKHMKEFIIMAFSIFILITPGFGLLLNGGGYISDRGYYFVWFVFAYCVLCGFEEILHLIPVHFATASFITFGYAFFICLREPEFRRFHLINIVFMAFILVLIFLCCVLEKKRKLKPFFKISIIFVSSIVLCRNNISFLWMPNNPYCADYATLEYVERFIPISELAEDEEEMYSKYLCKDEWFRVKGDSFLSANESLLKGFYPTGGYYSIVNCLSQLFFRELSGEMTMNSLLGVRYYDKGGECVENPYALPLIMMFDDYILEEQLQLLSPLERQNVILQKIVLKEGQRDNGEINYINKLKTLAYDIEYYATTMLSQQKSISVNADSHIFISLDKKPVNAEICIAFMNASLLPEMSSLPMMMIGGTSFSRTVGNDIYCYVQPGQDGIIDISFLQNGTVDFDKIEIYYLSYEAIIEDIEARRNMLPTSIQISNNKISAVVSSGKNVYALCTVPYDSGWTAYVDGVKCPIIIADYAFIGLPLDEGTHTIELVYKRPLRDVSLFLFVTGIISLLIVGLKTRKSMQKNVE